MALLQEQNVVYHHPLDDDTELTQSEVWTGTGNFAPAKFNNGLFPDTLSSSAGIQANNSTTVSSLTAPLRSTSLNTSQTILAYRSGTVGKARVMTLVGSGPIITYGPQSDLNSGAAISGPPSVSAVTPSKIVAAYFDGTDGVMEIGVISGSVITWSVKTLFHAGSVSNVVIAGIRDSKAIVAYVDTSDSKLKAKLIAVVGLTSTFGAAADIDPGTFGDPDLVNMMPATSEEAVIVYKQPQASGSKGIAKTIRALATGLSVSAELEWESTDITSTDIAMSNRYISDRTELQPAGDAFHARFLIMWGDSDGAGRSAVMKYKGDQLTPLVTGDGVAGAVVFENTFLSTGTAPNAMACAATNEVKKAVVGFADTTDGNKGVVKGAVRRSSDPYGDTTYSDSAGFESALINSAGTITIATLQSPNLIINPSGGDGDPNPAWTNDIGDWRLRAPFSVLVPYSGSFFFWPAAIIFAEMSQVIDLVALGWTAEELDSGRIDLFAGGYLNAFPQTPADVGQIKIMYLDSTGVIPDGILRLFESPLQDAAAKFELRAEQEALPVGTRFIKFIITATRNKGTNNDVFLNEGFIRLINNTNHTIKTHISAGGTLNSQVNEITKDASRSGTDYPTTVGSTRLAYTAWLKRPLPGTV